MVPSFNLKLCGSGPLIRSYEQLYSSRSCRTACYWSPNPDSPYLSEFNLKTYKEFRVLHFQRIVAHSNNHVNFCFYCLSSCEAPSGNYLPARMTRLPTRTTCRGWMKSAKLPWHSSALATLLNRLTSSSCEWNSLIMWSRLKTNAPSWAGPGWLQTNSILYYPGAVCTLPSWSGCLRCPAIVSFHHLSGSKSRIGDDKAHP
jgi:hypothetical protein